jgi:hypothetical protein
LELIVCDTGKVGQINLLPKIRAFIVNEIRKERIMATDCKMNKRLLIICTNPLKHELQEIGRQQMKQVVSASVGGSSFSGRLLFFVGPALVFVIRSFRDMVGTIFYTCLRHCGD